MTKIKSAKITHNKRFTWTWLIPIFILIMAGIAYWQQYRDVGPMITVTFTDATGISAGQTKVYYRSFEIGKVTSLELANDLNSISANIRLIPSMRDKIGDTTRFWIVTPRVGAGGVSGLDAILSGSYIEADWVKEISEYQDEFIGLDKPPLTSPGTPGRRLTLRGESAMSLSLGSPIYYRGIPVGKLEDWEAAPDFEGVFLTVFIDAPYDDQLNADTRFWNASGVEIDLKGLNAEINYAALQTMILGGIEFEHFGDSREPLISTYPIPLYPSRAKAEKFFIKENSTQLSEQSQNDATELENSGNPVEISALIDKIDLLLENLNSFLADDSTKSLPADISKSLRNLDKATASVTHKLDELDIAGLTQSITKLTQTSDATLKSLNSTLQGVSADSEIYYELIATMREIRNTSKSANILINTLSEKPNSLILGK